MINERLITDPIKFGKPLRGRLKGYRRIRVSDYRIIYIEHTQTIEIHEFLSKKINEENADKGTCNPFAFFIRDDTEQIIAGCSGSVMHGSIYTDLLWVHPDYRKKGMGAQLMKEVHNYGHEVCCKIATVATMSFQMARGFYEKLGYKCDLVRPGYVDGATCIFLKKVL